MSLPAVNLDKTKLSPSEGHTAIPFVLRRMRLTSTASVALVVIIALQNTDEQEVNLLWASPKISVKFLVVITIALTVVGQWLLGAVLRRHRKKD